MTTTQLEIQLSVELNYRQNLIVPNVTYVKGLIGFDVDLLCITPAGYAHGYELKISRADLRADFKKWRHNAAHWEPYKALKHFTYVVREKDADVALELVPPKFGITTFRTYEWEGEQGISFSHLRKPTLLSRYKWTTEQMLAVGKLAAIRIPALKGKIIQLKSRLK